MINLKDILYESINTEFIIRSYAWLYMLIYPYKGRMENKSWQNDTRMGISFIDAMEYLKTKNIVTEKSGVWIAKSNAKKELLKIFKKPNSRLEAEKSGDQFKKYNKTGLDGYSISNIPYDIYDAEEESNVKAEKQKSALDYDDYIYIRKWYKKFQRENHGWSNKLNKYLGKIGDLIRNKKYILFRGLLVDKTKKYKKGQSITDNRMSWTLSYDIAKRFAYGNTNWMDNKTKIPDGKIGIILEYTPKYSEILLDTQFINLQHPVLKGMVDFPDELEVIVTPKKKTVKIFEIIES